MSENSSECCKVGSIIQIYDFNGINSNLEDRWTGKTGEAESIRELTSFFNKRILEAEIRTVEMEPIKGQIENIYELLINDGQIEADKLQARSALRNFNIDIEKVESRFVSHQTMYRHLRNCLRAEKDRKKVSLEKERNRVHSIQHRSEAIVNDALKRLQQADEVDIEDFEVLINFRVICDECGKMSDFAEILDNKGCDCEN